MKPLVASLFGFTLGATFIGATCNTPVPAPPPDVIVDASPAPTVDATPTPAVDSAPAPVVDAGPPSPCQGACDALKRSGCREGKIADCANKICQINADPRFQHYNVTCLQNATTPANVAACGGQCTP